MAVTIGKDLCNGAPGKDPGGLRRYKMSEQGKVERRTNAVDRRSSKIDRRQFIDIGWTVDNERRTAPADRRQGREDRRGE